jgi:hypothetical protein
MRQTNREMYRQCTLERSVGTDVIRDVAYIPERLAYIGKGVELKDGGQWDGFRWIVATASSLLADGSVVQRKLHDGWNNNI